MEGRFSDNRLGEFRRWRRDGGETWRNRREKRRRRRREEDKGARDKAAGTGWKEVLLNVRLCTCALPQTLQLWNFLESFWTLSVWL